MLLLSIVYNVFGADLRPADDYHNMLFRLGQIFCRCEEKLKTFFASDPNNLYIRLEVTKTVLYDVDTESAGNNDYPIIILMIQLVRLDTLWVIKMIPHFLVIEPHRIYFREMDGCPSVSGEDCVVEYILSKLTRY